MDFLPPCIYRLFDRSSRSGCEADSKQQMCSVYASASSFALAVVSDFRNVIHIFLITSARSSVPRYRGVDLTN